MPEWIKSMDLCQKANPLWQEYFKQHFDSLLISVESKENDIEYQKRKEGDFVVKLDIPEHIGDTQTIETKIRDEWVYSFFKKDKLLLLEILGNVQQNKTGSAFLDSRADLYAYGFYIEGMVRIVDPMIFYMKPTQEWFRNNMHKYRTQVSNTNGLYNTHFKLVPIDDIPDDCKFFSLYKPKIRRLDELFWRDQ